MKGKWSLLVVVIGLVTFGYYVFSLITAEPPVRGEFMPVKSMEAFLSKWSAQPIPRDVNADGKPEYTVLVAFDDSDPLLANNVIFAYRAEREPHPGVVIWTTFERSNTEYTMHGNTKSYTVDRSINKLYALSYVTVDGEKMYKLIESVVIDRELAPAGKVALFHKDSEFGKIYFAFFRRAGVPESEVTIPTEEVLK